MDQNRYQKQIPCAKGWTQEIFPFPLICPAQPIACATCNLRPAALASRPAPVQPATLSQIPTDIQILPKIPCPTSRKAPRAQKYLSWNISLWRRILGSRREGFLCSRFHCQRLCSHTKRVLSLFGKIFFLNIWCLLSFVCLLGFIAVSVISGDYMTQRD